MCEAVELARAAATEQAGRDNVGDHLGHAVEDDRVVTHYFAATARGYWGWRWSVTLARASRSKVVTVDECVLLPGPNAILAPPWVPWDERVELRTSALEICFRPPRTTRDWFRATPAPTRGRCRRHPHGHRGAWARAAQGALARGP